MRFKVGDNVQVVKPYSGGNFEDGDIVTIKQVGLYDGDIYTECYGATSPHDNVMWFLYEDEVVSLTPDGVYIELFAVKDGVRYNAKVVSMKDMSNILTNSLMDGIEKLWK
jgi:hypothetical protein